MKAKKHRRKKSSILLIPSMKKLCEPSFCMVICDLRSSVLLGVGGGVFSGDAGELADEDGELVYAARAEHISTQARCDWFS